MLLLLGMMLLGRASAVSQCLKNYNSCGQGLPANFCCPSDTQCVPLASNTTAVCCPKGSDCSAITPTTCNIELMNPSNHPDSYIFTTALDAELPSCGKGTCCPFGYDCVTSGGLVRCVMAKNQAVYTSLIPQKTKAVSATSQTTMTTVSASATTTPDSTTSTTLASTATNTAAIDTTAKLESPGAAGRSAGLIAGSVAAAIVLLSGLAVIFWSRKRKLHKLNSEPAKGQPAYQHQNQHPWQYQPPAYPAHAAPETDPVKEFHHIQQPAFCQTITTSPAYVSVEAFAELPGTAAPPPPPPKEHNVSSPVELPASPVSFSMWSRQEENRRSARKSRRTIFKPPRAAFVPLSRFAPKRTSTHPDDGGNWI